MSYPERSAQYRNRPAWLDRAVAGEKRAEGGGIEDADRAQPPSDAKPQGVEDAEPKAPAHLLTSAYDGAKRGLRAWLNVNEGKPPPSSIYEGAKRGINAWLEGGKPPQRKRSGLTRTDGE